jgi:hypothetical protein
LENIQALLVPNTTVNEDWTDQKFLDAQNEVNQPVVIFIDKTKNEVVKKINIVADDMEKLKFMYEHKYFETTDVPFGKCESFYGANFIGVLKAGEEQKTESFDWLKQSTFEMLEDVAKNRINILDSKGELYQSPEFEKRRETYYKQYHLIKEAQPEEQKHMLWELDTMVGDMYVEYGDSQFIQGFYEGINYLKKAIEAGTKEKERSAATDVPLKALA